MWLDGEKASAIRRTVPIRAYVGANGSGKSLLAVQDALHTLREGRRVISSVRILDWENPRPCDDASCDFALHPEHGAAHPLWVKLENFQQILDAKDCHILMDEITGIVASRDTLSLPGEVADRLKQFRRQDVSVAWTAPDWADCDVQLRRVTQGVVLCRGRRKRKVVGAVWYANTLVSSKLVDARELDHLTDAMKRGTSTAQPEILAKGFQMVSRTMAADCYDTMDSVSSLHKLRRRGPCLTCGGNLPVPRCVCGDSGAPAPVAAPRRGTKEIPLMDLSTV